MSNLVVLSFGVPNTAYNVTGPNGFSSGTLFADDGGSGMVSPPVAGAYNITAQASGYEQINQQFNYVPGQVTTLPVPMVKTTDPNNLMPINPNPTIQQALSTGPVIDMGSDDQEYIPPNDQYNKYFTATQARIYVGNLFVDEVNGLQFVLQDNTVPIYGYASRFVDAYGQGRSLVQGQLALNFVSEGYMFTVLDEFHNGAGASMTILNDETVARIMTLTKNINIMTQQNAPSNQISNMISQRNLLVSSRGLQGVQAAKSQLQVLVPQTISNYNNATYSDIVFDMVLLFGEGLTQRTRKLEKIKLTSNEVILDQSGNQVLDCYGFIARRLL